MLVDENKNSPIKQYQMWLKNSKGIDGETIGYLSERTIMSLTMTYKFKACDEMTLKLPFYVMQNHNKIKNPLWDLIKNDFTFLVEIGDKKQVFVIDNTTINKDDKSYITIKGYSNEYQSFGGKRFIGYKVDNQLLYDSSPKKSGILNKIAKETGWSIGTVPADISNEHRDFNLDDESYLSFLQSQIPTLFGENYFVVFDSINKNFSILDLYDTGINRGLTINKYNYMKSFQQDIQTNELITCLRCLGKDDTVINSVMLNGQGYIENYSYYRNSVFMSDELLTGMNEYDAFLETKKGIFANYLKQLDGDTKYKYQGYVETYQGLLDNYLYGTEGWLVVVKTDENHSSNRTYYIFTGGSWNYQDTYANGVTNGVIGLRTDFMIKEADYRALHDDYKGKVLGLDDLMENTQIRKDMYKEIHGDKATNTDGLEQKMIKAFADMNNVDATIGSVLVRVICTNTSSNSKTFNMKFNSIEVSVKVLKSDSKATIIKKLVSAINDKVEDKSSCMYAEINSSDDDIANVYVFSSAKADDITVTYIDTDSTGITFDFNKTASGILNQITLLMQETDRLKHWTSVYGETQANNLMLQLSRFQRFGSAYKNDSVTDPYRLKTLGEIQISKLCLPKIEFSTDIINLLRVSKFQHDWDKIVLLDKINIGVDDFGLLAEVRLVEIEEEISSEIPSLKLTFSSVDKKPLNEKEKMAALLIKASNTVNSVNSNLQDLKDSSDIAKKLNEDSTLDWNCNERKIKSGTRNKIEQNERGILMTDEDDNDRQVLLSSGGLFYTRDNWATVKTGVSSDGVFTEFVEIFRDNNMNKILIDLTSGFVVYQNLMFGKYFKITSATSNTAILGGIPVVDSTIDSTALIILNGLLSTSGYLEGNYIEINSEDGTKEQHKISVYNPTTHEITIDDTWINIPSDETVDYALWQPVLTNGTDGGILAKSLTTNFKDTGNTYLQLQDDYISLIDNTTGNKLEKMKLGLISDNGAISALLKMGVGSSDLVSNIFTATKNTQGMKFKLTNSKQDLDFNMLFSNGSTDGYGKFLINGDVDFNNKNNNNKIINANFDPLTTMVDGELEFRHATTKQEIVTDNAVGIKKTFADGTVRQIVITLDSNGDPQKTTITNENNEIILEEVWGTKITSL